MIIRTKNKVHNISNVLIVSFAVVLLMSLGVTVYQASEYQNRYYSDIETDEIRSAAIADEEEVLDENGNLVKKGSNKKSSSSSTDSASDGSVPSDVSGDAQIEVLLALGDSLTNTNTPNAEMMGDNKSYSFSTGTNISSFYLYLNSIGKSINPINIAISGTTTTTFLSNQLPSVSSYNPSYITILIGGNDLLQYYENPISAEQLGANLETIANGIEKSGRRVFMATIPDYNTMRSAAFCTGLREPGEEIFLPIILTAYNQKIAQVASNHSFTLVDLYPYLDQDDISSVDCIHPNLAGQQIIANRFKAAY